MLFVYINVIMICKCKSKAFCLHLIYKHDIPLKLTFSKGIAFGKQRFHGLVESYKKVSTLPKIAVFNNL